MSYRFITAIVHVVSQLLFKWLPPPALENFSQDCAQSLNGFETLMQKDWQELVMSEIDLERNKYSWAEFYKQKFDKDGKFLSKAIYEHVRGLSDAGAEYILFCDEKYPPILKTVQDPPLGITVIGNSDLLSLGGTAIVGSRKASAFALHEAFKLGYELSIRQVAVVSGGALGCDIASHEGVLASGSGPFRAVVVFAGGLENLYPAQNFGVFVDLRKGGAAFVSERLWNQPARAFDFPIRNRIISGLTTEVLIIQADLKSGAMITARKALDQGREVYVLMHPKDDIRASGNHRLLEEGALGFLSTEGYLNKSFLTYRVPA